MEQVIVEIDPQGQVTVEAQGVKGADCQALTKAIEESIGRTSADQKKPEYFQQQSQGARANAGTGNPR